MNKVQKIMSVMVLVVAIVLPTKAQISGQMSTPVIAFRSTSAMAGSGSSYSATPLLSANGLALYEGAESSSPNYAPGGPRRVGPPTPEGDPTPVGDAVVPMMLLLGAYCGFVYYRRKKKVKSLNR